MITRIISKPNLQAMLKACRAADLNVAKLNGGYTVKSGDKLLLKAMNGKHNYLIRIVPNLFEVRP